jgi:hypothetical protein
MNLVLILILREKLTLKNTLKNLQTKPSLKDISIGEADLLETWTLEEAYSTFSNKKCILFLIKKSILEIKSFDFYILLRF